MSTDTTEPRGLIHKTFDDLSEAAQAALEGCGATQRRELGDTATQQLSDALLDWYDDATLRELIDFDLRAMLGVFQPDAQMRALRALLVAIDEDRIVGSLVTTGECGCVIGNLLHFALDSAGYAIDPRRERFHLQALIDHDVLISTVGGQTCSTYDWALMLRNQSAKQSGGALRAGRDLLLTEMLIYPLLPALMRAELGQTRTEQQVADDARRVRLLREAVSTLLVELNPGEWVCSEDDCYTVVPGRDLSEQHWCVCPHCENVYCPTHLHPHIASHRPRG